MYFTICIPSYNRANTLPRTLDSLVRQSFKDFEVIVVDDGSTDNTAEVIKNYLCKLSLNYINKENGGKLSALNKGIENAKGIFFLILDSDDQLTDDALDTLHSLCEEIIYDDSYTGALCRSINISNNQIIGDLIPDGYGDISYIDMHFKLRNKGLDIKDCTECNRTSILKKYRWPEGEKLKFVPEALIFDQIGLNYKFRTSNKGIKLVEYQEGGISLDREFKNKYYVGFLYHYISRIEKIIPNADLGIKEEIIAWWRYFGVVKKDKNKEGPRVKKITFLGYLVYLGMPLINYVYKTKYHDLYVSGR